VLDPSSGTTAFRIKPATIPSPPETTIDVTIELQRLLDLEMGVVLAESVLRRAAAPDEHGAAMYDRALGTQYDVESIIDLRNTLLRHQQIASKYVDFTDDLSNCTWENVLEELRKAQFAAFEAERRGNRTHLSRGRARAVNPSILAPGVTPLPEELSVLSGGLAVIFSVIAPLQPQIIALADKLPSLQDTVNSTGTRSSRHSRGCQTSLRKRKTKPSFCSVWMTKTLQAFGCACPSPRYMQHSFRSCQY